MQRLPSRTDCWLFTTQNHLFNETTIEDNEDNAQSFDFDFDVSICAGDNSVVSQSGGCTCVDQTQNSHFPAIDTLLLEVTVV